MPQKNQEDSRTPPGFAVVVHLELHQFSATLVCRSVRGKLYRLQLLAHAYQQPASEVQVLYSWQLLLQLWLPQQHYADSAFALTFYAGQHHGQAAHHAALSSAQLHILVACRKQLRKQELICICSFSQKLDLVSCSDRLTTTNALALCLVQTADQSRCADAAVHWLVGVGVATAAGLFDLVVELANRAGGIGHALLPSKVLQQC